MADITIFSCPKPFVTPDIRRIQENAFGSWKELGPEVTGLLAGDESGTSEAAGRYGWDWLPTIRRNHFGTPLLSDIFAQVSAHCQTSMLAYVNADIILTREFVETALCIFEQKRTFLIVGQRWDLPLREPLHFSLGWESVFKSEVLRRGRRHAPNGSDYFIFPRGYLAKIPEFAVGRSGWDNWMIYKARKDGYPVVDASAAIWAVHQDHNYDHLGGNPSHHGIPESLNNITLAGGRHRIFMLGDADYMFAEGQVRQRHFSWKGLGREAEVIVSLRSESPFWPGAIRSLTHPWKSMRQWRGAGILSARGTRDRS